MHSIFSSKAVRRFCAVVVAVAAGPVAALAAPQSARPADAFVDTVGVGVHAHYDDTAYGNWDAVRRVVAELGVRNVRSGPYAAEKTNQLAGVRVNVVIDGRTTGSGRLNNAAIPGLLSLAKNITNLRSIEGPNEYDLNNGGDANWQATLLSYQSALYNQVKNDPLVGRSGRDVSVVAPSVLWWNAPSAPNFSAVADFGNMHSYPGGQRPFNGLYSLNLPRLSQLVGGKPLFATETGYHTAVNSTEDVQPGVSEAAQGKYVPRLFMEYFNAGVPRTFNYELLDEWPDPEKDESEKNYGLVRNDFTLKPAAVALKNTIALLKDPGEAFTPGALDYSLVGADPGVIHHTLLQKRDGDFYLALWQEVQSYDTASRRDIDNADVPVTLLLDTPIDGVETYLVGSSTDPVGTFTGPVTRLDLRVPDGVLLVRLTPVPEPTGACVVLVVLGTTLLRRRR